MLADMKRVAVIAPHPDDEILGCGGTMARLIASGTQVDVVVLTRGQPPLFSAELVESIVAETRAAHEYLGIHNTHFLNLPAAGLDQVGQARINQALGDVLTEIAPDTIFLPFIGDIHPDHQLAFTAAMVWARPRSSGAPSRIWAYETLSETNWWAPGITPAFVPNCYVDIGDVVEKKVNAFRMFVSQVKPPPDERSIDTILALATTRGSTVYRRAAEAFMVVRQVA